jgi:hypothetical protein
MGSQLASHVAPPMSHAFTVGISGIDKDDHLNKQAVRAFLESNGDPQAAQRALAKWTTVQTGETNNEGSMSQTTTERERLAMTDRERERQREREMIQTNGGAALSLFGQTQSQTQTRTQTFDRRHAVSAAAGDAVCVSMCLCV